MILIHGSFCGTSLHGLDEVLASTQCDQPLQLKIWIVIKADADLPIASLD